MQRRPEPGPALVRSCDVRHRERRRTASPSSRPLRSLLRDSHPPARHVNGYGLFSLGDAASTLNDLLAQPTVIRLSQLPGDQVKNAVAEFFLMALYSFLIRREHPHRLERLLVLDEAWRLVQSPFLEPLMREGRAFGLGVMIATQFPRDLPDSIAGSTATRVFFNQTKAEQVREIQRTLVGKTSGTEADHLGNLIRGLAPLECILQNLQYRPWVRLRAIPYFSRVAEQAEQE